MSSLSSIRGGTRKTMLPSGLSTLPDSLTALSVKDTIIFQIHLFNDSAGAVTVTVQDGQASPKKLFAASIAANTAVVINWPEGVEMVGGLYWQADTATAVNGEVVAFVKG